MKKKRIAIASVLKPVDDPRAFDKLGKTLRDDGYEIHLFGYPSERQLNSPDIHFKSTGKFSRISITRLLIPFRIALNILKVKPDILIVNTHELLIVAITNRILFGTRLVFDVQENYYQNIISTNAFPPIIRHLIAGWVRLKERVLSPFFSLHILAEKSYENELPFGKKSSLVLENKAAIPADFKRKADDGKMVLLFSGTIAESTGIFEAIRLAEELHALDESVQLTIIGYCPQVSTLKTVKELVQGRSYIKLIGGDTIQPHAAILDEISRASFGMISYPPSPHISNRIPTKLYEYLAAGLPVLLQENPVWETIATRAPGAIVLDYEKIDVVSLLTKMKAVSTQTYPKEEFLWSSEKEKLCAAIARL